MALPRPDLWLRARPRAFDAVFAGVVLTVALLAHALVRDPKIALPTWWSPLLVIASCVPLVWRRRWPVVVLALVSAAELAVQAGEFVGAGFMNVLVAAYTVGAHLSGRRLWATVAVAVVLMTTFVGVGMSHGQADWGALISVAVLSIAAFLLGDNMRRRRERAAELEERAERAERERELLAHQRVQQERTRIARELHDVVAHSVSVMIIQAGAARRQVAAHPDRAIESMEAIESTGRDAMNEMRRILGVLRGDDDGDPSRAPQPSLDTLGDLVTADDLPIVFRTCGDLAEVPSAIELSAYRVVQEALTNVRRHAGVVRRVEVEVNRTDHELVVSVADDGRGAGALARDPGYGITGMTERVAMFGGRLDVGPRTGGGWRVRASFPLVTT